MLKYVNANTCCIDDKGTSVIPSQSTVTTNPKIPEINPTVATIPPKQNKTKVEQICQGVTNANQSDLNPIDIEEDVDIIHMKHVYESKLPKSNDQLNWK